MPKPGENPPSPQPSPQGDGVKPTLGRTVHFVLSQGPKANQHRPAIIVSVGKKNLVNLQVFTDGDGNKRGDHLPPVLYVENVVEDEASKPGTWHWPERD